MCWTGNFSKASVVISRDLDRCLMILSLKCATLALAGVAFGFECKGPEFTGKNNFDSPILTANAYSIWVTILIHHHRNRVMIISFFSHLAGCRHLWKKVQSNLLQRTIFLLWNLPTNHTIWAKIWNKLWKSGKSISLSLSFGITPHKNAVRCGELFSSLMVVPSPLQLV